MSAMKIVGALVAFLVLGAIMAGIIIYYQKVESKKDFKPIDAKIVSVTLEEKQNVSTTNTTWYDSNDRQRQRVIVNVNRENFKVGTSSSSVTSTFKPVICYEFTLNDQKYNNCMDHQSGYMPLSGAQNFVNSHPKDTPIKVYYNSNDPTEHRWSGNSSFPWIPVGIVGVLMLIIPLIILFSKPVSNRMRGGPGDVVVNVN